MRIRAWVTAMLQSIFQGRQMDADLEQEIESAAAELSATYRARGLDPESAAREARLALGGSDRIKEEVRDERVGARLESVVSDVRQAIRGLYRVPGFSVAVILTFGLGIGANTAIY